MKMGCNWVGIPEMRASLAERTAQTVARMPNGPLKVMQGVYERSQGLVPVKTGALKASGRVLDAWSTGREVGVDVAYGSAVVHYALDQHENPFYHHPVGQSQYLRQPLLESMATAAQTIADELAWR